MGYELYITRADFFWEAQEHPITEDEWLATAGADSDLQRDTSSYLLYETATGDVKRTHPWILEGHPDRPPFWFRNGAIFTTNPDAPTIAKMVTLAKNLNAQVIGEEGETYDMEAAVEHKARPHYRKRRLKSLLSVPTFFVLYSIFMGLTCRFELGQLTIILAIPLGWLLVTHGYVAFEGRMTVYGDLLLLATALLLIGLIVVVFSATCNLLPDVASCIGRADRLRSACIFTVSFPLGISSFSLWLWFRIRQFQTKRRLIAGNDNRQ